MKSFSKKEAQHWAQKFNALYFIESHATTTHAVIVVNTYSGNTYSVRTHEEAETLASELCESY